MTYNKAALNSGFKKAKQIIFSHIYNQAILLCENLIKDALSKREFQSFTGNTITSFACGIYIDGDLNYMVASGENMSSPVHAKIQRGQTVYLKNPYEGSPRRVTGKVDIKYDEYGMETSFKILQSMKPDNRGISIIMTTGTEYSTYLESVYNLNVLTDTSKSSNIKSLLYSSFKPLP